MMVEFHVQAVPRMDLADDASICMAGMLVCGIRDQLVYVFGSMSAALPRAWSVIVAGVCITLGLRQSFRS